MKKESDIKKKLLQKDANIKGSYSEKDW